jgi:large subunit ribosomal protein L29
VAERKPARPRRESPGRRGRKKSDSESTAPPEVRIAELNEELFKLRFQFATRQLTNTSRIRQVRRDLARARTLQRQQQLAAATGG